DYKDRVVIKDVDRKFFGGINNQLNFKNFSVQFLWEFVKQEGRIGSLFDAGQMRNQREEVIQALDDGSEFQRISTQIEALIANSNVINTAFPYEDASFLRLKTLSIGYVLPTRIMQTMGINTSKLFLSGQNLLTITDYTGMDPENPSLGTSFAGLRTIS